MNTLRRRWLPAPCCSLAMLICLSSGLATAQAQDTTPTPAKPTVASTTKPAGLTIFSAGHSFHVFIPGILSEIATSAGIEDHVQQGVQSIGGSRVIQHWDLAEDKNKVKPALATGQIQVLTLSPIYLPDDGIEKLATLAQEKNPQIRVLLEEFWLPYDVYALNYKQKRPEPVDRATRTVEQIQAAHAPYFASIEGHVKELNQTYGKDVLFVVPVGQAAIALREKIIAGEAPGIKSQEELFRDPIGHATPPLQALAAYCFYSAIYGQSPAGLPMPRVLKNSPYANEDLNRLLQQLAWQAVSSHPLTGVKE